MAPASFVNPLSPARRSGYAQATRHLKNLTREILRLDEDSAVTVSELTCRDPGCPDLETVIAILKKGEPPRFARIHKPLLDVTAEDVRTAFTT